MSLVPFTREPRSRIDRYRDFDRPSSRRFDDFDKAISNFETRFNKRASSMDRAMKSLRSSSLFDDKPRGMFGSSFMNMMMRDPFAEDPFFSGRGMPSLMGRTGMEDFMSPIAGIMSSMGDLSGDGNCQTFSSSSVMTMTTGPDGRPQLYQASSSSRSAPGGVKETRRSVADSRTGVRKMAIGHHLDERSHVIEKEIGRDGELEERQEFVNLEEEEAPSFDAEFQRRANHGYGRALDYRSRSHASHSSPTQARAIYRPALPSSSNSSRRRQRPMIEMPSNSRHDDRRQRERGPRQHRN